MSVILTTKPFHALTLDELYAILALRSEVFIVEQQSIYQDLDGHDQQAQHIMALEDGELVGYTRALPPGTKYPSASFGRLVIAEKARRTGLGRKLLLEAVGWLEHAFPAEPIKIDAQAYLKEFYQEYGFKVHGEEYILDGIPHYEMWKGKA